MQPISHYAWSIQYKDWQYQNIFATKEENDEDKNEWIDRDWKLLEDNNEYDNTREME